MAFYQPTPADLADLAAEHGTGCAWHLASGTPVSVRDSLCDCTTSWLRHSTACLQRLAERAGWAVVEPCSDGECCSGCYGQSLNPRAHAGDATDACPGYLWLCAQAGLTPFDNDTPDDIERAVLAFVAGSL